MGKLLSLGELYLLAGVHYQNCQVGHEDGNFGISKLLEASFQGPTIMLLSKHFPSMVGPRRINLIQPNRWMENSYMQYISDKVQDIYI